GPADLAARYSSYGALKRDVADAVNAVLDPLRKRYDELAADPAYVDEVLRAGAERARESSEPVLRRVRDAMGLTCLQAERESSGGYRRYRSHPPDDSPPVRGRPAPS